eukprot:Filipodium_phascolosomae@DN6001_c0_g1_i1.p1
MAEALEAWNTIQHSGLHPGKRIGAKTWAPVEYENLVQSRIMTMLERETTASNVRVSTAAAAVAAAGKERLLSPAEFQCLSNSLLLFVQKLSQHQKIMKTGKAVDRSASVLPSFNSYMDPLSFGTSVDRYCNLLSNRIAKCFNHPQSTAIIRSTNIHRLLPAITYPSAFNLNTTSSDRLSSTAVGGNGASPGDVDVVVLPVRLVNNILMDTLMRLGQCGLNHARTGLMFQCLKFLMAYIVDTEKGLEVLKLADSKIAGSNTVGAPVPTASLVRMLCIASTLLMELPYDGNGSDIRAEVLHYISILVKRLSPSDAIDVPAQFITEDFVRAIPSSQDKFISILLRSRPPVEKVTLKEKDIIAKTPLVRFRK